MPGPEKSTTFTVWAERRTGAGTPRWEDDWRGRYADRAMADRTAEALGRNEHYRNVRVVEEPPPC